MTQPEPRWRFTRRPEHRANNAAAPYTAQRDAVLIAFHFWPTAHFMLSTSSLFFYWPHGPEMMWYRVKVSFIPFYSFPLFFFLAFFFHLINKDLTRHAAAGARSRSDRHGDPATACWLFFALFSVSAHSRTLNALIPTVASLQCENVRPRACFFALFIKRCSREKRKRQYLAAPLPLPIS